jgi:hypothetical protein
VAVSFTWVILRGMGVGRFVVDDVESWEGV